MKHKVFYKARYILIILIGLFVNQLNAQSKTASFFSLSAPEKWWVIWHPFKAKKAFDITKETLILVDSLKSKGVLTDINGGTLDAFKHSYWMASLSANIGENAALALGRAHEKGNFRQFKKGVSEDGALPDKPSSDMDLFNNSLGAKIGMSLKGDQDQIIQVILTAIYQGEMRVLLKNEKDHFLTCSGNQIDLKMYQGVWEIPKCLVPSNKAIFNK